MADTPTDADTTPEVAPLDVDGVGAVAFGTIAWTVGLVLCLIFRGPLADAGNAWWTWVCLAGALLGLSLAAPPDARAPRGTSLRARQGVTRRKKRHPPEPALGDVVTPRGDEVPRGGPVDLPGSAAP